jgi:hypothetical protein
MTKQILMYLVHFHVHHSFGHHHSWIRTVANMTQITCCWVISPILDMEKEKKKQTAEMKLQDEHNCLSLITNQIIKIHEEGGFLDWGDGMACVCKAMDTLHCWWHLRTQQSCRTHEWRTAKFIYWDCRCLFDDLSSPIPMCSLITSKELKQAHLTEDGLTNLCK